MAEALLRHLSKGEIQAYSAGIEAIEVRPLAVEAMRQIGIDISGHESKTLDRYLDQEFDAVVTVCDDANERCPIFPDAKHRLHWSVPDPSKTAGSEADRLQAYARTRDALRALIQSELLEQMVPHSRSAGHR